MSKCHLMFSRRLVRRVLCWECSLRSSRNIPVLRKNVGLCRAQDSSRRRYSAPHLVIRLLFMPKRCLDTGSDAEFRRTDPGSHSLHCSSFRIQLKCDGTRWRTVGDVKGKLANGVGSQYPSHYLGTWCIQHYYSWCAHLGCAVVDWTDATADLNGLVRFAERWNVVFARVPSHFNWPLHCTVNT